MKYLKTNAKIEVKDYPYGWKKTSMFFSLDFKKGKGFRSVRQTINPKTGKLNAPKRSTYSPVMVMVEKDGKISYSSFNFYGDEGIERAINFFSENFDLFDKEQITYIALETLTYLKADIHSKVTYCNSPLKEILPLYEEAIKKLVEIINTGENLFHKVRVDFKKVKATEEEGYQPFKITSSGPITLTGGKSLKSKY